MNSDTLTAFFRAWDELDRAILEVHSAMPYQLSKRVEDMANSQNKMRKIVLFIGQEFAGKDSG